MPAETETKPLSSNKTPQGSSLLEAPISITVRGYKDGFSVLLTRYNDANKMIPLLDGVDALVEELKRRGYKPSWAEETNIKALGDLKREESPVPKEEMKEEELPVCQIHNKPMKKRTGANGAVFYSHAFQDKDTGKWVYCSGKGYGKK